MRFKRVVWLGRRQCTWIRDLRDRWTTTVRMFYRLNKEGTAEMTILGAMGKVSLSRPQKNLIILLLLQLCKLGRSN